MSTVPAQPTASEARLDVLNRLLAQDFRAHDGVPEDGEYNNRNALYATVRLLKTQPDLCREYKNLSRFYHLGEDCGKNIPTADDANNDINRLIIDFTYNIFDGLLDKYKLINKDNKGKNILHLMNSIDKIKYPYINRIFEHSFYFGVYDVRNTNQFQKDECLLVNFITSEQLLTGTPDKLKKINTKAVNVLLGLDSLSAKTIDSIAKLLHEDRVVAELLGDEQQCKLLKRLQRKPKHETEEHLNTRLSAVSKLTIPDARDCLLKNLVNPDRFDVAIRYSEYITSQELQAPALRAYFQKKYVKVGVQAHLQIAMTAEATTDYVTSSKKNHPIKQIRQIVSAKFQELWPSEGSITKKDLKKLANSLQESAEQESADNFLAVEMQGQLLALAGIVSDRSPRLPMKCPPPLPMKRTPPKGFGRER